MIRVSIELIPGGIGKPRLLHVIHIWNLGDTTMYTGGKQGDYSYAISRKFGPKHKKAAWSKQGTITRFPRASKNSVHLLHRVLKDALE